MGNEGIIRPVDVQWMTAGARRPSPEMPEQRRPCLHNGLSNLAEFPAAEKMKPALIRKLLARMFPKQPRYLTAGMAIEVIAVP